MAIASSKKGFRKLMHFALSVSLFSLPLSGCEPEPVEVGFLKKSAKLNLSQILKQLRGRLLQLIGQSGLSSDRQLQLQLAIDGVTVKPEQSLIQIAGAWVSICVNRLSAAKESRLLTFQLSASMASESIKEIGLLFELQKLEFDKAPAITEISQLLLDAWFEAKASPLELVQGAASYYSLLKGRTDSAEHDQILEQLEEALVALFTKHAVEGKVEEIEGKSSEIKIALGGNGKKQLELGIILKDLIKTLDDESDEVGFVPGKPLIAQDPENSDVLQCVPNGNRQTYDFFWKKDGKELPSVSESELQIEESELATFNCGIKKKGVETEVVWSAKYKHGSVLSGNIPVSLIPSVLYVNAEPLCSAEIPANAGYIAFDYRWYKNGELLSEEESKRLGESNLPLIEGDVWSCSVAEPDLSSESDVAAGSDASDTEASNEVVESHSQRLEVANAPPRLPASPQVSLVQSQVSGSGSVLSALECEYPTPEDFDGETVSASVTFLQSGSEVSGAFNSTLPSGSYAFDEDISCEVELNDGVNLSKHASLGLRPLAPIVRVKQGSWSLESEVRDDRIFSASGLAGFSIAERDSEGFYERRTYASTRGQNYVKVSVDFPQVALLSGSGQIDIFKVSTMGSVNFTDWKVTHESHIEVNALVFDDVEIESGVLFASSSASNLISVFDVSVPGTALLLSDFTLASPALELKVENNVLFALESTGLRAINYSDLTNLSEFSYQALANAVDFFVAGGTAFVSSKNNLHSVDYSTVAAPALLDSEAFVEDVSSISCLLNECFTQHANHTITRFDVANVNALSATSAVSVSNQVKDVTALGMQKVAVSLNKAGVLEINFASGLLNTSAMTLGSVKSMVETHVSRQEADSDIPKSFIGSDGENLAVLTFSEDGKRFKTNLAVAGGRNYNSLSAVPLDAAAPASAPQLHLAGLGAAGVAVFREDTLAELGRTSLSEPVFDLLESEEGSFVANGGDGVKLIAVSNTGVVSVLAQFATGFDVKKVVAFEGHVLASSESGDLAVLDFSDKVTPKSLFTHSVAANPTVVRDVVGTSSAIFVSHNLGLTTLVLSETGNLYSLEAESLMAAPAVLPLPLGMTVLGQFLFVGTVENSVSVFDISDTHNLNGSSLPLAFKVGEQLEDTVPNHAALFTLNNLVFSSHLGLSILN